MGSVVVEIFRKAGKNKSFPGTKLDQMPLQRAAETSTTSATTAGSRITVGPTSDNGRNYFARITADEIVFCSVGSNPTAALNTGWRIMPNVDLEVPVIRGDKFSFIDLA